MYIKYVCAYIYISFSLHIWSALGWPFLAQQIKGFLLSAADLFAEDCFMLSDTLQAAVFYLIVDQSIF